MTISRNVSIGASVHGHDNRLTLLRLMLAAAVMIEHIPVVVNGLGSPLIAANGWSIGYAAVNGFFILSGFLIAGSLEQRRDLAAFAASRILRIMPAIIVLALVAVFAVGPRFTTVEPGVYWTSLETWLYIPNVTFFLDTSGAPEGVFATNPAASEFSATLWTLRYEVIAYGVAALLFFSRFAWRAWAFPVYFVLASCTFVAVRTMWPEAPDLLVNLLRFSAAFLLGMSVYAWRDRIPLHALPVIAVIALPGWFVMGDHPAAEIVMNIAMAAGLFWLAFVRGGVPTFSRLPDWSYGLYIWHYPVFQIVWYVGYGRSEGMMAAVGIPLAVSFAAVSWHLIERPALTQKTAFGHWLGDRFQTRSGQEEGEAK